MKSNVFLVITSIIVLFAAVSAFVQAFTSMNAQMSLVIAVVFVVLTTQATNKRSFTYFFSNIHVKIKSINYYPIFQLFKPV